MGAFFFWVVAVIDSSIGQACVFFVVVYSASPLPPVDGILALRTAPVMALIKAQGVQYFAFALLTILMSFNGIYVGPRISFCGAC